MIILFLVHQVVCLTFNKKNVIITINAGHDVKTYMNGLVFYEDKYYSSNTQAIENVMRAKQSSRLSEDEYKLLSHGRYSEDQSFQYELPLFHGPGDYELLLIFIESFFTKASQRAFSIRLGDHYIIQHLDIYGMNWHSQSKNLPYHMSVKFSLTQDELIKIGNVTCPNAYKFKTHSLVVEFDRIYGADVPKVEALVLFWQQNNDIIDNLGWLDVKEREQEVRDEKNQRFYDMLQEGHFESLLGVLISFKGFILFILIYSIVICVVCYDDSADDQDDKKLTTESTPLGKVDVGKQIQSKKRKKRD